jgi:hypothetical protein
MVLLAPQTVNVPNRVVRNPTSVPVAIFARKVQRALAGRCVPRLIVLVESPVLQGFIVPLALARIVQMVLTVQTHPCVPTARGAQVAVSVLKPRNALMGVAIRGAQLV